MSDKCDAQPARGWVLYDGDCSFCRDLVRRTRTPIEAAGFRFAPLQSPWVRDRLRVSEEALLAENRVLTADGRVFGGADALLYLARALSVRHRPWWAWLLVFAGMAPFGKPLLRAGYRWVAARRYCRQGACSLPKPGKTKEGTQ